MNHRNLRSTFSRWAWALLLVTSTVGAEPTQTEPTQTEPTQTEPTQTEPTATEPTATEPVAEADHPPVRWICNDVDSGKRTLTTRFEPGAVALTWQGETTELKHVPSEVGAAYVGWPEATGPEATGPEASGPEATGPEAAGPEATGKSFRVRPDSRAVLTFGSQAVGCRAHRRGGREPMPAAGGPSATELATALVMGIPRRRLELFGVVGAIQPDPDDPMPGVGLQWQSRDHGPISSLRLEADFDLYHGNPDNPDPELKAWSVSFRGDPEPIRELLRSQYGEPRELARPVSYLPHPQIVWRYGHFYLTTLPGSFELTYRKWEPEWVIPPIDEDTAQREIARVERIFRGGIRVADFEAEFGPLGPDQWGESLEAWTRHWRIDITPAQGPPSRIFIVPRARPIPAGSLIRTLGIENPVVVSRDVHMSSRQLEDRDHGKPRLGGFKIEICIDKGDQKMLKTDRHPPMWSSESYAICAITLRRGR